MANFVFTTGPVGDRTIVAVAFDTDWYDVPRIADDLAQQHGVLVDDVAVVAPTEGATTVVYAGSI